MRSKYMKKAKIFWLFFDVGDIIELFYTIYFVYHHNDNKKNQ